MLTHILYYCWGHKKSITNVSIFNTELDGGITDREFACFDLPLVGKLMRRRNILGYFQVKKWKSKAVKPKTREGEPPNQTLFAKPNPPSARDTKPNQSAGHTKPNPAAKPNLTKPSSSKPNVTTNHVKQNCHDVSSSAPKVIV